MSLQTLREEINLVDSEIISLIRKRMAISAWIAEEKRSLGLPTRDPDRAAVVMHSVEDRASAAGLDPLRTREVFSLLITMSEEMQDRIREKTGSDPDTSTDDQNSECYHQESGNNTF